MSILPGSFLYHGVGHNIYAVIGFCFLKFMDVSTDAMEEKQNIIEWCEIMIISLKNSRQFSGRRFLFINFPMYDCFYVKITPVYFS
jgi:hypothetical protein